MPDKCSEVTFEVLLSALRRVMGTHIEEDALKRIAEYVLNIFGYGTYYPDYRLNQEERNLFYLLEDNGIVMTHEEKMAFPRGGSIRIGFWVLKKRRILELAEERDQPFEEEPAPVECIYDTLDQEAWSRGDPSVPADESPTC